MEKRTRRQAKVIEKHEKQLSHLFTILLLDFRWQMDGWWEEEYAPKWCSVVGEEQEEEQEHFHPFRSCNCIDWREEITKQDRTEASSAGAKCTLLCYFASRPPRVNCGFWKSPGGAPGCIACWLASSRLAGATLVCIVANSLLSVFSTPVSAFM